MVVCDQGILLLVSDWQVVLLSVSETESFKAEKLDKEDMFAKWTADDALDARLSLRSSSDPSPRSS